MRTSWLSLSLLALSLLPGCNDAPGDTSSTNATSGPEDSTTTSTGDGDGDGDGDPGESPDTNDTENGGEGACIHECMADADCMINGQDLGFVCTDNVCIGASSSVCTTNDECIAQLSG